MQELWSLKEIKEFAYIEDSIICEYVFEANYSVPGYATIDRMATKIPPTIIPTITRTESYSLDGLCLSILFMKSNGLIVDECSIETFDLLFLNTETEHEYFKLRIQL